jgi:hypothetical protein
MPDDQRREQQRRDDHLDHPQEGVGERFHATAEGGPEIADDDADDETDEDLRRQSSVGSARRRRDRSAVELVGRPAFGPADRSRALRRVRCTNAPIADTTRSCCARVSSP